MKKPNEGVYKNKSEAIKSRRKGEKDIFKIKGRPMNDQYEFRR